MTGFTDAVKLLGRAVTWTHDALEGAATVDPHTPTPCGDWTLAELFDHMADGLDAFTEASNGLVMVDSPAVTGVAVTDLIGKACALLTAWSSAAADSVRIRDASLSADVLLHAAAVEIAVHGWDVGRASGCTQSLPDGLALALTPAATLLLASADRPGRFHPPLPGPYAAPSDALLAQLGRDPAWGLAHR